MRYIYFLLLLAACKTTQPIGYDPADVYGWTVSSPGNTFHHVDNTIVWNGQVIYVVLDTYNKVDQWYNYLILRPGPIQYIAVDLKAKTIAVTHGEPFYHDTLYVEKHK